MLNENIKTEVEEWFLIIINFDSVEIIEFLTLIVERLGLSKLYTTIKNSITDSLKKEVRQKIEEIVDELDGHVEDPYYGMI